MNSDERKKILLVEDEVIIAAAESRTLARYGYNVITATSGEKAISFIDENPPVDMVLMDINLGSGISGTDAAEIILSRHDIPVVFLSSHTEREVVDKTEGITSYGYIVKNSGDTVMRASIEMAFRLFASRVKEKESEAFRNRVFESSCVPIVIMDSRTFRFIDCNPAAVAIYGLGSREDAIGRSPIDVSAPVQYDGTPSQVKAEEYISSAIDQKEVVFEWLHRRPDGRLWDAEVHLMSFQSAGCTLLQFTLQDITRRKAVENALESWKIRYDMIVTASGMVVYEYNVASGEIKWGDSMHTVLGYTDDEISGGIDQWIGWLHPEDRDATLAYLNDTMEKCGFWDAVYRLRRKDSGYVWMRDRGFFVAGPAGHADRQLGLLENITEHRKADEKIKALLREKEMLLKEVHHRIKNNIAAMENLMSLQLDDIIYPEARSALHDAIGRIKSMRMLYDSLEIADNYQDISINGYISRLIDSIRASFTLNSGIEISMEIDDIVLGPKMLYPLGLICNELVTNAIKYAFEGKEGGTLNVSVKRAGGSLMMVIRDDGIGLPPDFDMASSNRLGLMLVTMLANQLSGTFSITGNSGTTCTLSMPL